jgi:hypothetical protein
MHSTISLVKIKNVRKCKHSAKIPLTFANGKGIPHAGIPHQVASACKAHVGLQVK